MLTRRAALLASAAVPFVRPAAAQQPSTLRIAMTLADIPVTDGAPDQGTEGIRFMGYTMYDPLLMWDLSSATEPAKLVPGLATKWYQDPAFTFGGGGGVNPVVWWGLMAATVATIVWALMNSK